MALAQAVLWNQDIHRCVDRRWRRRLLEVSFSPLVQWATKMIPLLESTWKCWSYGIALAVFVWINAMSKSEAGCDVQCPASMDVQGSLYKSSVCLLFPGWRIMSMQNGEASAVKSEQSHAGSKRGRRVQVGEGWNPRVPWDFCLLQSSEHCPDIWRWNRCFVFFYMGLTTHLRTHLKMHLSSVFLKRYLKHSWIIMSFLFQLKVLHKSHLNLQRSLATQTLHFPENLLKGEKKKRKKVRL